MEIGYNELMEESFWIIPLIVAIVQAFKMTGFATKFAPIISLGVGVGISFLVNSQFTVNESILAGVVYGLSASGLYSGVRTTQTVRDVKTGKIPYDKVDKDLFNEKDKQEIQNNQQKNNNTTDQS